MSYQLSKWHPESNGWRRIGCPGRRSLWARLHTFSLELRAGREGDDGYSRVWVWPWQRRALLELLGAAEQASELNKEVT